MCGIVGITSTKQVSSTIINSLKKLEYRGYDSAGIATLNDGQIKEIKCEGRVDTLEKNVAKINLVGNVGIGGTFPQSTLEVIGNLHVSGTVGNITASGDLSLIHI